MYLIYFFSDISIFRLSVSNMKIHLYLVEKCYGGNNGRTSIIIYYLHYSSYMHLPVSALIINDVVWSPDFTVNDTWAFTNLAFLCFNKIMVLAVSALLSSVTVKEKILLFSQRLSVSFYKSLIILYHSFIIRNNHNPSLSFILEYIYMNRGADKLKV